MLPAAGTKAINPTAQTPPRVCNQSQSPVLRPRWAACTRLLSRTHTSRGRKFAWADAESGMQTRHDPLPCGVSALLLNPDRPKQKARMGGVFRAPQKRQTRFSKPSTGTLNLIWSLNRIDRGRKKPVYAMIQPAHTVVCQTEKELLLNLSAYGMIP